eukprot:m.159365 g.159365  ORF g.159365 m.159365 type:complete len:962 (+) comp15149_c0_seq3:162-3047(+)
MMLTSRGSRVAPAPQPDIGFMMNSTQNGNTTEQGEPQGHPHFGMESRANFLSDDNLPSIPTEYPSDTLIDIPDDTDENLLNKNYVPVELAKSHLQNVVNDIQDIKRRNIDAIGGMRAKYEAYLRFRTQQLEHRFTKREEVLRKALKMYATKLSEVTKNIQDGQERVIESSTNTKKSRSVDPSDHKKELDTVDVATKPLEEALNNTKKSEFGVKEVVDGSTALHPTTRGKTSNADENEGANNFKIDEVKDGAGIVNSSLAVRPSDEQTFGPHAKEIGNEQGVRGVQEGIDIEIDGGQDGQQSDEQILSSPTKENGERVVQTDVDEGGGIVPDGSPGGYSGEQLVNSQTKENGNGQVAQNLKIEIQEDARSVDGSSLKDGDEHTLLPKAKQADNDGLNNLQVSEERDGLSKELKLAHSKIAQLEALLEQVPSKQDGDSVALETELNVVKRETKELITNKDNQIEELRRTIGSLETEIEKHKDDFNQKLTESKEPLTLKIDSLEGELDSLHKRLAEENSSAKRVEGLEHENSQLQENIKLLEAQSMEFRKGNEKKQNELEREISNLNIDLKEQNRLRRKYYNIIEDMKGKVRVYCRVRPLSSSETARGNESCILPLDEFAIQVHKPNVDPRETEFTFDRCFTEVNSQEDVYEDTGNLIQSAVDGFNVCIFAYGQTGSGKTFTMIGDSSRPMKHPGIAPRAFSDLFRLCRDLGPAYRFKIQVYMVELYCGDLVDLLGDKESAKGKKEMSPGKSPGKTQLKIRKNKKGLVYVSGLTIKEVENEDDLNKTFELGSKNRHVSSHKMNQESSRSHLVIGLVIETLNTVTQESRCGKLSLVDLAGSERFEKTGATGIVAEEAKSINKSLQALAEVINSLSEEKPHVPYRNSILTQLMQDSLGGNAKTLMFVNVSPADYNANETVAALRYAQRAKCITNNANKNSSSAEVARLNKRIEELEAKLEAMEADD